AVRRPAVRRGVPGDAPCEALGARGAARAPRARPRPLYVPGHLRTHRSGGPGALSGAGPGRREAEARGPGGAGCRRCRLRMERDLPALGRRRSRRRRRRQMILDIAAKRAVITPDRPALLWEGRWLSYRELNDRAERLAGALLGAGVGKGDRVALLAHNHIAHIDTLLATAKTGAVYTPLNVRLSEREQRELADYLRPALVMHDADNADKASATGSRAWDLSGHEARLGDADLPQLPDPDLTPDDVQMILLTGGTTGLPKG